MEEPDSDSDLSDIEKCVKKREENLRLNQEFFQQFGILQAKQDLMASQSKKTNPSQRGLKREKVPAEPRRSSLRLQNKTPEGLELPPKALIAYASYTPAEPEKHQSIASRTVQADQNNRSSDEFDKPPRPPMRKSVSAGMLRNKRKSKLNDDDKDYKPSVGLRSIEEEDAETKEQYVKKLRKRFGRYNLQQLLADDVTDTNDDEEEPEEEPLNQSPGNRQTQNLQKPV